MSEVSHLNETTASHRKCDVDFSNNSAALKHIVLPSEGEEWPIGTYYVEISSLQDARRILGPESPEIRQRRSQLYFSQMKDKSRTRLRLGMHDRGEEYVFANGIIHQDDIAGQRRHLPLHVKVIRLSEYRIRRNDVFDVTSSHSNWPGLHFREELYVYVHIDTLIVEPGASIEVHGNVMILICDRIILDKNSVHAPIGSSTDESTLCLFEIRILGTRHPAFGQFRRLPAQDGRSGVDGKQGSNSNATQIIATPFGPSLQFFHDQLHGENGGHGTDGENGTSGQNGGMAMLADIRLGELVNFTPGSLKIIAQASPGCPGGKGGDAGNGGDGGDGADGLDGIEGLIAGGLGGAGGDGGQGGDGGRGGNGGLASNIFVQIPDSMAKYIDANSYDSEGGPGGVAGKGGTGGRAGESGTYAPDSEIPISSHNPRHGRDGNQGRQGVKGRSRPGAAIHILTDVQ